MESMVASKNSAMRTCLMLKVLFRLPLRQTTGLVASLLELTGLDWAVPDVSTLSRRMKTLEIDLPKPATSGPLHLLVDSTGIKVEGEGEWNRVFTRVAILGEHLCKCIQFHKPPYTQVIETTFLTI